MQYNEQQRKVMSADAIGRVIKSLEWVEDGKYWVMTFDDDYECSLRFMAELVGEGYVYTVERLSSLVNSASENLRTAGYSNVTVFVGDGTLGLPDHAPYDRISEECAAQ